jgi:hypothetical protein
MKKIALLTVATAGIAIFALSLGAVQVGNIWSSIFALDFSSTATGNQIIWQSRAPRIIGALLTWGPMGKDGIGARCGLVGHQVSRRLIELQRLGQIFLTGRTVLSNADRPEREWTAVPPAPAVPEVHQQQPQPNAPLKWAVFVKETP